MLKKLVAAILVMAVPFAEAQVRIIDSEPSIASPRPSPRAPATANSQPLAASELYFQVQTLQQEVLDLRGLVEQQAHEIKQLKQQRLDDYVDLDRRISQLSQSERSAPGRPMTASPAASAMPVQEESGQDTSAQELASYRTAIDLILKKQNFDAGIAALKNYLRDYPRGNYAANAQYWLGQIYLQKNELEQSKEWFGRMIATYPRHQKAAEAKFKLGKAHHLLGETQRARDLLQEVAGSGSDAAGLAEAYLKQHF